MASLFCFVSPSFRGGGVVGMWVPGGLGDARDLSGRFPFSLVVVFIMCVYVLFSTSPPLI